MLPPSLSYLNKEVWRRPIIYAPWAKSAISFVIPYNSLRETSESYTKAGRVWISRYAFGKDYHNVLKKRLKPLKDLFEKSGFSARICVDSFPIFERRLAQKAGLGFIGRNGLFINPKLGSFVFLAEIITDADLLEYQKNDAFPNSDFCKKCQKCVSSCPTKALKGDGSVEPSKCISSYNVEWKGKLPDSAPSFFGNLFGCDICQEVCPYNKRAPLTKEKDFFPKEELFAPFIYELLKKNEKEIAELISGSPLQRRGAPQIIENLRKIISETQTKRDETELSS
ncbi:MAG: tRNA epoxyqueuosine(34) reductase QueG [Acidobacteria bacterium]|nr:tRNA epoxyqueuosine(34) reductase QueG [Acidobacteriota bacterium]